MNPVTKFMVAALAAIALLILAALMDGPSETQAAQDVADYSAALADGGVSLCKEFGCVPVWTKAATWFAACRRQLWHEGVRCEKN